MCSRDDDPSMIDVPRDRMDTIHDTLVTGGGCRHRFTLTPECERVDRALGPEESDEQVLARLLASVNLPHIVHEALGYGLGPHPKPTCGDVAEAIEASLLARIRSRR